MAVNVDICQPMMISMTRNQPYYSKRKIINLISSGNILVTDQAQKTAKDCFGWDISDIEKAIKKLPLHCCYKSEQRFDNPSVWVDYYRAPGLLGENVYTHFYVEDEMFIVDSFKDIDS